ncbi:Gfo/Idh/MocA family oxidoreductase [bacterium]|nr:Gfo/Idh/MocA family oxidoreductase [bacterium]
MRHKIRVAVLGVGHLGQHHARIYAEHDACDLIGIVDSNAEQARKIADMYQIEIFDDFQELIGRVEAISIATPTETHYELARYFLEHGVHVLLEKPIARTIAEAENLVQLSREQGILLQIGHLERFNAAITEGRRYIDNPGFIETQRLGSFSLRSLDIDVVLDLMIHDIDIVLSLVQSPLKSVSAVGVPVISPKIDIANARLEFESGCVANLTASRVSLEQTRKIRIFQPSLYLSIDYANQKLFYCKTTPPQPGSPAQFPKIDRVDVPIERREPLKEEIAAFLECIMSGTKPIVTGEDGLEALRVAYTILGHVTRTNHE